MKYFNILLIIFILSSCSNQSITNEDTTINDNNNIGWLDSSLVYLKASTDTWPKNAHYPVAIAHQNWDTKSYSFSKKIILSHSINTNKILLIHKGRGLIVDSTSTDSAYQTLPTPNIFPTPSDSIKFDTLKTVTENNFIISSGKWIITEDLILPENTSTTIEPGAHIFINQGISIYIKGDINILGELNNPIVFTSINQDEPWGALVIEKSANITNTIFSRGGADSKLNTGHSNSHPVLNCLNGKIEISNSAIIQNEGKGIGGSQCEFIMKESLISWNDMGGEFHHSVVNISTTHFLFFPFLISEPLDDDNDGLYLYSDSTITSPSIIDSCIFYKGKDDGIDQNGALVEIKNSWFDDFNHEGIATSSQNSISVENTTIINCQHGLEAGYGSPNVTAKNNLFANNDTAIYFGDNYPLENHTGTMIVSKCSFYNNNSNAWGLPSDGYIAPNFIDIDSILTLDSLHLLDNDIGPLFWLE